MSAPASAVSRAASGNHWSQQISTPRRPNRVGTRDEAQVAGREVELFVKAPGRRGCASCGSGRRCGRSASMTDGAVVVNARRPPLEDRQRRSTRPVRRASGPKASVVGPGIGSARSNSSADPRPGRNRARGTARAGRSIVRPLPGGLHDALPRRWAFCPAGRHRHLHQADFDRM